MPKTARGKLTLVLAAACAASVACGLVWAWMATGEAQSKTSIGLAASSASDASKPSSVSLDDLDLADTLLDPTRQKYIWDAEHVTHMMEWRFGIKFRQALAQRDGDGLAQFFHPTFAGQVLDLARADTRRKGLVSQRLTSSSNSTLQQVPAEGMVAWLIGAISPFASIQGTRLRVLTIDQLSAQEGTWEMELLVAASGIGQSGELVSLDSTHRVVCRWSDESEIDGGSILWRWVTETCDIRTCPRRLMEEVTDRAGLSQLPIEDNWKRPDKVPLKVRFQIAVEDFDQDGYWDIALSDVNGRTMLLRSVEGQRFVEATRSVGLPTVHPMRSTSFSAGWVDYDNDGFPDLLMGGRLYHNEGGRRSSARHAERDGYFVDVTAQSGLSFQPQQTGCTVADYDLDGLLDVYFMYASAKVRNQDGPRGWIGDDESGAENRLWRNLGGGQFRDVTQAAGAGGGRKHTMASTWLFADPDHYPDLYVANDFATNVLLRNRGDGTFADITDGSGTSDYPTSMGVASGDLDNDGLAEIYVANMFSKMGRRIIRLVGPDDYPPGVYEQIQGACAGNRLYRIKAGETRYSEHAEELGINGIGWAYAPAMVDFDNDGRLDLYATTGFMSFDRHKPDG